ncbi:MAG: type I-E CRISPR-associated protein Cas6/Cse3/CasE [Pedobacter sp.]
MFLSRIHLDLRCKDARRDLSNPYQLHSSLCRAFSPPDTKCPEGEFMWRLEPETDSTGNPRILVQSKKLPVWTGITVKNWLADADKAIDLKEKLKLDSLKSGQRFRFRLRANPCVSRKGKRLGLLKPEEQERWLERKGLQHGFSLPNLISFDFSEEAEERIDVRISQEQMLRDKQHSDNSISIFSVLFDGTLIVDEPDKFRKVLQSGIGHGKVMGLGLLSVVPIL